MADATLQTLGALRAAELEAARAELVEAERLHARATRAHAEAEDDLQRHLATAPAACAGHHDGLSLRLHGAVRRAHAAEGRALRARLATAAIAASQAQTDCETRRQAVADAHAATQVLDQHRGRQLANARRRQLRAEADAVDDVVAARHALLNAVHHRHD